MSDKGRIQLNLRLDGHKELYEAVKAAAVEQDTSVNQFVINALKAALGWEVEQTPSPEKVEALEQRLASLEQRLASLEQRLALVVSLEERLATLEEQRGKFQKTA